MADMAAAENVLGRLPLVLVFKIVLLGCCMTRLRETCSMMAGQLTFSSLLVLDGLSTVSLRPLVQSFQMPARLAPESRLNSVLAAIVEGQGIFAGLARPIDRALLAVLYLDPIVLFHVPAGSCGVRASISRADVEQMAAFVRKQLDSPAHSVTDTSSKDMWTLAEGVVGLTEMGDYICANWLAVSPPARSVGSPTRYEQFIVALAVHYFARWPAKSPTPASHIDLDRKESVKEWLDFLDAKRQKVLQQGTAGLTS